MTTRSDKVRRFRELHSGGCFTIPNPWDIAGARMMTGLGFKALATTSSGYAFSKGKRDMTRDVDRDETLQYAAAIAASTELPVTADTEDCYADTPDGGLGMDATGRALKGVEDAYTPSMPPILILQGLNDGNVDVAATRMFAKRH